MPRSRHFVPTLIFIAGTVSLANAQSDAKTLDRIVDIGKNHNQVMKTLRSLTNIGPRLTSSTKLRKAQDWAMGEFRRYGLKNVHLEKWGDVPVGFERGSRQVGRMVTPFESEFEYTTQCWMPGTNGPVIAEAVKAPADVAGVAAEAANLKGKWAVVTTGFTMRGPDTSAEAYRKALGDAGVAGVIYGSKDERVHSSGSWKGKTVDKHPSMVEILVRKSDFDRISRNIWLGRKPTLEFNIENRFLKGPLDQYNVVADIVGTEKPNEFVIVCGHLDSWNSPASQGACDNGTGSSVAIEAARILSAAKAKPTRTIRFVLWSGEEQGLFGSRGYVQTHKDELDNISAVLNDDGGSGYQGGYSGLEIMKPMMEAAFAPTVKAFPEMPMKFGVLAKMPDGGSSDHAPFVWEGIPGFFTIESGKANYGKVWHTQFDRYEEAIPEYLVQSSANHAIVSYSLACAPTLVPRGPKPPPHKDAVNLKSSEAIGADHNFENHDHNDEYWQDRFDRLGRFFAGALSGVLK